MWKLLFIFILLLVLLMIFPSNKSAIEESFTTPVALHIPTGTSQDGKPFFIGNLENKMDTPIVPTCGKYEFRKPEFLYDGVWKQDYKMADHNKFQLCNSIVADANFPINKKGFTYAGNHFFDIPKQLKHQIVSPPDCPTDSLDEYNIEPVYMEEPTQQDVLGIQPMENFLEPFPKVRIQ